MQDLIYNMRRIRSMYRTWYQPDVHMTEEEWIYLASLLVSWLISFGFGLLIGVIIC